MTSLRRRLLLSTFVGSVILTVTTGIFLGLLFNLSIEKQFDYRLQTTLTQLVGDIRISNQKVQLNSRQSAPLFSNLFSGWYWEIVDVNSQKSLFKSSSLYNSRLFDQFGDAYKRDMFSEKHLTRIHNLYLFGLIKEEIRVYAQFIRFPELDEPLLFIVSGNSELLNSEAEALYWFIAGGLTLLVIGLMLGTYFQTLFVLKPLRRLEQYLTKIRNGDRRSTKVDLPLEIMPVVNEINNLIDANEKVVERARTHVGNLAHALKTPISVLLNIVRDKNDKDAKLIFEQVKMMSVQVTHYLNRARMIASLDTVATKIDVNSIVKSIVNALTKIHFDKNVDVELSGENVAFLGEKQDCEELVGNLIDNAFKWCNGKVVISISKNRANEGHTQLHILVEDDGPFMPIEALEKVLQRGKRIDENMEGTGLGLSIVKELTELYNGKFSLSKSSLGGLKAELWLPLA